MGILRWDCLIRGVVESGLGYEGWMNSHMCNSLDRYCLVYLDTHCDVQSIKTSSPSRTILSSPTMTHNISHFSPSNLSNTFDPLPLAKLDEVSL